MFVKLRYVNFTAISRLQKLLANISLIALCQCFGWGKQLLASFGNVTNVISKKTKVISQGKNTAFGVYTIAALAGFCLSPQSDSVFGSVTACLTTMLSSTSNFFQKLRAPNWNFRLKPMDTFHSWYKLSESVVLSYAFSFNRRASVIACRRDGRHVGVQRDLPGGQRLLGLYPHCSHFWTVSLLRKTSTLKSHDKQPGASIYIY